MTCFAADMGYLTPADPYQASALPSSLYIPISQYRMTPPAFIRAKNTYTPLAPVRSRAMPPIKLHTITLRLFPRA